MIEKASGIYPGKMSLSLPGTGEKDSIYTTEGGHSHENWDHEGEVSVEFLGECLKNIENLIRIQLRYLHSHIKTLFAHPS